MRHGPVVFGALRDKRVPAMLDALRGYATQLTLVEPEHPRGWAPERMVRRYGLSDKAEIADSTAAALRQARAACRHGEAVLATGSRRWRPTCGRQPACRMRPTHSHGQGIAWGEVSLAWGWSFRGNPHWPPRRDRWGGSSSE